MLSGNIGHELKVSFHEMQLFSAFLFFLLIPLKNSGVVHYVIWVGALSIMGNTAITVYRNKIEKRCIVEFLILLLVVVLSLCTTEKQYASGLLYSVLCYFSLYWVIALNDTFLKNERTTDAVYKFGVYSGLLFTLYSFMPFAYYRDNDTVSPTLTLYFGNSNLTGIYIFCTICIIIIYKKNVKGKALKALLYALVAYLLYLLWMTGARTCIVAMLFVILSSVLPAKYKIPNLVIILCFLIPILFVPMYLLLYKTGYTSIEIMGKAIFSGRQHTYRTYLSLLGNAAQWLVGNLGEAGLANAHNAPLAHLCSTGIIGITVFYGMLLRKTLECNRNDSRIARSTLICILGIYIQSSGEASMLLGGFPGIVFVYILFYLAGKEEYA